MPTFQPDSGQNRKNVHFFQSDDKMYLEHVCSAHSNVIMEICEICYNVYFLTFLTQSISVPGQLLVDYFFLVWCVSFLFSSFPSKMKRVPLLNLCTLALKERKICFFPTMCLCFHLGFTATEDGHFCQTSFSVNQSHL